MLRLTATLIFALTLSACSAITSVSDDEIPCATSPSQPNPCPSGFVCISDFCRPGGFDAGPDVPRPDTGCEDEEACNDRDDDCDGLIDEGHDVDGDGVTWCGGGLPQFSDCNDNNPEARPAVPEASAGPIPAGIEVCNGVDEDCDGVVDEAAVCPSGTQCLEERCAAPTDCTLTMVECGESEFCDPATSPPTCQRGGCMTDADCVGAEICDPVTEGCVVPLGLGSPCSVDAQCANDAICVESAAAGLSGAPAKICATPCCTDSACPADALCHASGTGARLCIPAAMLGKSRGGGLRNDSCSADSNCDSGLCNCSSGTCTCMETCSNEADCGTDTCTTRAYVGPSGDAAMYVSACDTPVGGGERTDWCFDGSDCRSGSCWSGLGLQNFCGGPCGRSSDCGVAFSYCAYYAFPDMSGDVFARCRPKFHEGSGTTGSACGMESDCRDLRCSRGECADACCSDSYCPSSYRCRPLGDGAGRFPMHCVKS